MTTAERRFPFPLKAALLLAFTLLSLFLPLFFKGSHAESEGSVLASYREKWQVRWSDGDASGTEGWRPLNAAELARFAQYKGVVWLRRDMPKLLTDDPHVMLLYGRSFEAYENGRLLVSYNMSHPDPYVNHYIPARIVKLSQGDQPRTLAFKLLWNRNSMPQDWSVVGDRRMLDRLIVQNDFVPAVFSVLLTAASAVSLLVFLRRRSETLYAWFALITGCAGIGFFSMLMSLRFFLDLPVAHFQYFRDLLIPIGVLGFVCFYGRALRGLYVRMYRIMAVCVLLYTVFTACLASIDSHLYEKAIFEWSPILVIPVFVLMSFSLIRSRHMLALKDVEEFRWLTFGFVALTVGMSFYFFSANALRFFGSSLEGVLPIWLYYALTFALEIGLLLFVGCLLMVVLGRFSGVYRDLQRNAAELETANRELETLSRLKDDFLSHTSHELRTPLHGIAGLADALLDGAAGPVGQEMERNLRLVRGSADRLLHLVNDILDMDRLRHGDMKLKLTAVDALGACETVAAALAPLARRKGLQLTVEREDTVVKGDKLIVSADSGRLEQILYNLIGNAIRYTESGYVRVTAAREGESVRIVVADSGPGIPEDRAAELFEPFATASSDYGGGMGLGLPITNRMVRLHGGELTIDSKIGAGTTLSFALPAAGAEVKQASDVVTGSGTGSFGNLGENEEPSTAALPVLPANLDRLGEGYAQSAFDERGREAGEKRRPLILVADDEPVNLEVLRHYLRRSGYRLVEAANGTEAALILEQGEKPDLLLLDAMMPGKTGYEVCRIARERWSASELPIILLSAQNRLDRLTLGFDSGANDYLSKPFTQGELLARVDIQLKLAQFHHSLEELVRTRTEELEAANRHLAGSVRETAEALAEVSVLEERNRIAHDMHDLVGHSLTAAIVQIEAAKKLADRDLPRSVERMNAAGEMIRKGLNDVRRTVRMLKDDEAGFDLPVALQELIRESAGQADVFFEYNPEPLPQMGGLAQKVVYHALMEGITNGLRHGRCSRFRFELTEEKGWLRFELVSNGEPYGASKPGFGLSAMMERVHLLSGTVTIGEAAPGIGCRLRIMLPLEDTDERLPELPA
ncbi:Signal transduction histidine kinase [Cohnella sp. OV330]|uniref:ATP-binding protein n=1 Tax=Cohnella sp. OV330 TaxID=1855288 RepID=UPI0008E78256|nr:ATP-binding protein [Cohnella sp. OV330]SFB09409.1 Signal transduction histidine kinase [Cohnella sp. OV330]